jgi:hypothetical protein
MRDPKILKDRELTRYGFGCFASSSIGDQGRAVVFRFPSGAEYKVPLEYLIRWFVMPEQDEENDTTLRFVRSRRRDPHLVRVFLSDGRRYDVAWDTVLMACEPRYEHFGGLTSYFKEIAPRWLESHGPFRTDEKGYDT